MLSKSKFWWFESRFESTPWFFIPRNFLCGSIAILLSGLYIKHGKEKQKKNGFFDCHVRFAEGMEQLIRPSEPGMVPKLCRVLIGDSSHISHQVNYNCSTFTLQGQNLETLSCSSSEPTRAKDNSIEIVDVVSITKCIGNSQCFFPQELRGPRSVRSVLTFHQ